MKKLLALIMALAMVLSLSATAFAAGVGDTASLVINVTTTGTGAPDEDLTFAVQKDSQNADGFSASYNKQAHQVTVTLPEIAALGAEPGLVGEYNLVQTDLQTAGMTYGTGYTIKVYLYRDDNGELYRVARLYHTGEKDMDGIENTYAAGTLAVSKIVAGNMGDRSAKFTLNVTFNAPAGETVKSVISYRVGDQDYTIQPNAMTDDTETVSIVVSHEDTVTFNNIPEGVIYDVVEDASTLDGYTPTYNFPDTSKTISGDDNDTATVTNTKDAAVDTGIMLDSLPYVLLLTVCVVCMVAFFVKKRSAREF